MIGILIAAVVGIVVGVIAGITYRKKVAEKEIGSAEEEATRIINDSIKAAESKKREAVLEAKEEIHKSRADLEREIKEFGTYNATVKLHPGVTSSFKVKVEEQ